jgi:hypothetical protein
MSHSPCGPNGTKWRRIAPLNRRLGQFELYSQNIQFVRPVDSSVQMSNTMAPLLARSSAKVCSGRSERRLANSISQDNGRSPPDGGTPEFLPHRFQIFHFDGTTLASPEVQLASQRIRRVQFSVEESVQDEFPIRAGAGRAHAGIGRRRREHGNVHHVAEREH